MDGDDDDSVSVSSRANALELGAEPTYKLSDAAKVGLSTPTGPRSWKIRVSPESEDSFVVYSNQRIQLSRASGKPLGLFFFFIFPDPG